MVKKMHGQFFFQLSTLKCLFLKFRFLIMMLLLCVLFDDSISMGLVSSSSVSSSGTSTPREARLLVSSILTWTSLGWGLLSQGLGSGLGGKAGSREVGKIKLEEMASTSKSLHLNTNGWGLESCAGQSASTWMLEKGWSLECLFRHAWWWWTSTWGSPMRQRWHQWSRQFLHQALSVGSEESWWFRHLLAGEGIVVPPLYIMGQANAPATTNAQAR